MYAFLGVAPWKNVQKGNFEAVYAVGHGTDAPFTMQVVKKMNEHNKPIVVVNDITDRTAQEMIAFSCRKINVKNDIKWYEKHQRWTKIHLRGLLMWYECDIYTRPTGRTLFVCVLPNREYTADPGPTERSLTWGMADVPSSEELPTVIKPILAQHTVKTEKEKEKKHEKLVCGTEHG